MRANVDQRYFDAPTTYDDAAEDYERAGEVYWSFLGTRTVERLGTITGSRVLDVACGTGSSLVAAAERVGTTGHVVGVDLADRMLNIARSKVARRGLRNVDIFQADMTQLPFQGGSFDVVQSVLALFFAADMARQVTELWRLVRPGGRLAVTTFGHPVFAPMNHAWALAARTELPNQDVTPPWARVNDPAGLRALLSAGGIPSCEVAVESRMLPLESPSAWWPIVVGSGLRRFVNMMGPDAAARVRAHNEAWASAHAVDTLTVTAIYAVVAKEM